MIRHALRRAGVELLIWSSRLLVPVMLCAHLVVAACVAGHGRAAVVTTLLTPGLAEIFWLLSLDLRTGPGQWVMVSCLAVVVTVAALAGGMVLMAARPDGVAARPR
jgi:hypothetical protein